MKNFGLGTLFLLGWVLLVVLIRPTRVVPTAGEELPWHNDLPSAVENATRENKPILVSFTADWCSACRELDQQILSDSRVMAVLKNSFILLRLDVSHDSRATELQLRQYGVMSLPTLLFLAPDGSVKQLPRILGVVSVEEFLANLQQALTS